jgi:cell wall-associated NlpC family hydrolase
VRISHDRRTGARVAGVAAVAALVIFGAVLTSTADPSQQDVADARDRLEALNGELSVLTERLNLARLRLQDVTERLGEMRAQAASAKAEAEAAIAQLNESAREAYIALPDQLSTIFGSQSYSDLSDRLEFIGRLAQADADTAARASVAQQRAVWLAEELATAVEERRDALNELERSQDVLRRRIADAQATFRTLSDRYQAALAAARAAPAAPASSAIQPIPGQAAGVEAVIAAARSVVGSPYVFGAADPSVGFDCSGLTMWAWAHAGVSLPHSSTAQYSALPRIDRTQLQPGDLVFSSYGRLGSGVIDHVALYIGGGQTIAASNPSTGVAYRSIDWNAYVGAGRPG